MRLPSRLKPARNDGRRDFVVTGELKRLLLLPVREYKTKDVGIREWDCIIVVGRLYLVFSYKDVGARGRGL